jgi:hypothetical protein
MYIIKDGGRRSHSMLEVWLQHFRASIWIDIGTSHILRVFENKVMRLEALTFMSIKMMVLDMTPYSFVDWYQCL